MNGVVVLPMENRCPSTVHTETPNADRSYLRFWILISNSSFLRDYLELTILTKEASTLRRAISFEIDNKNQKVGKPYDPHMQEWY